MMKMDVKFNYRKDSFDFIDSNLPALMGHCQNGIIEALEMYETESIIGNIYRAKVIKILDHLECAFVDIGLPTNAYLPRKFMKKNWNNEEINQGDTIYVEVKKAPVADKGAVVTMDYSLKGEDLVLLPMSSGIKLSSKIIDKDQRDNLKKFGKSKNIEGGIIFRTESITKSKDILDRQLKQLVNEEDRLMRERNFLPTPKLLYSKSPLENFLLKRGSNPLVVNNKQVYKKLIQNKVENMFLDLHFSLRDEAHFRRQFDRLFSRVLYLENGSNIYIDQTEALTVIDVNTAHAKDARDFEEYANQVNILASQEIIRQIKLRNISGMIVIDFLRTEKTEKRDRLLDLFKNSFKKDTLISNIFGFTDMGLFEMNRQRKKGLFVDDYNKYLNRYKKEVLLNVK